MRILLKNVIGMVSLFGVGFGASTVFAQAPTTKPVKREAPKQTNQQTAPSARKVPVVQLIATQPTTQAATTQPTTRPTTQSALSPAESLVQTFWQAVLQEDYQGLFAVTGVPFVSDAKCNVFVDHSQIEAFLKQQKLPKQVKIGRPRTISPDDKHPAYIVSFINELAPAQADCDDEKANTQIVKAAAYPVQFVAVTLSVGDQEIVTVMRLSEINGVWVVTGLKN